MLDEREVNLPYLRHFIPLNIFGSLLFGVKVRITGPVGTYV